MHEAVGYAVRYKAGPVELPVSQRTPMRLDSIFDQASITKVYTAILALQLVEAGQLDLAAPVKSYLDEFPHTAVTISHLLTHTSGLPVGPPSRTWQAVVGCPLVEGAVPGTVFRYTSVGIMVLGRVIEKLTGLPLDQAVKARITGPLGLRDTGFHPLTWAPLQRIVATDARTSRGLLQGTVHDDVCNALGGVAGHAGLFSSAMDLAVVGQMLLNRGIYQGKRMLSESIVDKMVTNANPGLPSIDEERPYRTSAHGLGVVLDQPWFMGKLSAGDTFGHTGFTGTSLVVSRKRKTVLVVLTNRAHPNWSWANPDPVRVDVANSMP
jgi:CubicO group peptidase (beta-lactamase class C family)